MWKAVCSVCGWLTGGYGAAMLPVVRRDMLVLIGGQWVRADRWERAEHAEVTFAYVGGHCYASNHNRMTYAT